MFDILICVVEDRELRVLYEIMVEVEVVNGRREKGRKSS
jgi:hypothetical protein